ncbi:MAG: PEP-CTERM sorting domain-containing protein [Planctomycetia bacterium]|nr:MAG: PEP-CTERM sorting domain-containing protein [Planctomycetia bacterium]
MRKFTWKHAVATLVLSASAAMASAATVKADFINISPSRGDFDYVLNGNNDETTAGVFNWQTVPGGDTDLGLFQSFCIELGQGVGDGVLFSIVPLGNGPLPGTGTGGPGVNGPMGSAKAALIGELWARRHASIFTGTTSQQRDKAAAFQVAIWEIVYDDGLNLDGGAFRENDSASWVDMAKTWLGELNGDPNYTTPGLVALTHPNKQDQVTLIPEPTSLGLLALGGVGAWMRRRR